MKITHRFVQIPLTVAITLGMGISLGGCSTDAANKGGNTGASPIAQSAATSGGGTPAQEGGSAGIVDKNADIPDWLAAGFPLYPGSRVAAAGEAGDLTIISFSVPNAEEQEIYDWFVEAYSQGGWATSDRDDEHGSFEAANSDGRTASINVTKSTFVISASQG